MTDKEAFGTIFRQHYNEMYRLALRMLGDPTQSKDVVSEVFMQLLDSRLDIRRETLGGYLQASVRNRCLNLLKKRKRAIDAAAADAPAGATDEAEQEHLLLEELYRYIDTQLPPMSRKVMQLHYQQGLKYREISEELKVSEVTVYHHLSRSIRQLRTYVKSKGYILLLAVLAVSVMAIATVAHIFIANHSSQSAPPATATAVRMREPSPSPKAGEAPVVFRNTELSVILDSIANHYQSKVVYADESKRHIRLYFAWHRSDSLMHVVEQINGFERFHLSVEERLLTVE